MMMSIFSSFDALSGEFFGQKANKLPSGLCGKANGGDSARNSSSSAVDGGAKSQPEKLDAGKSSPSSSSSPAAARKRPVAGPRFAVELDGVHCFETLVRY